MSLGLYIKDMGQEKQAQFAEAGFITGDYLLDALIVMVGGSALLAFFFTFATAGLRRARDLRNAMREIDRRG